MRRDNSDIRVLQALLALSLLGLVLITIGVTRIESQPKPGRILPPPDFDLRLNSAGNSFEFTGMVDFGLTTALRNMVAVHPEVRHIILESDGGYVSEARGVVTVLRDHGIATHVAGHCASACALIFVGGTARSLGPDGRLGLHGYSMMHERHFGMIDPRAEMQRDLAIYHAQGLEESFVAQLEELPVTPMWYPDRAELLAARMLTQP